MTDNEIRVNGVADKKLYAEEQDRINANSDLAIEANEKGPKDWTNMFDYLKQFV